MLTANEIDLVEEILTQLKDSNDLGFNYPINENEISDYFNNSLLMKDYADIQIYKSAKIPNTVYDAFIIIVQVEYTIAKGRYSPGYTELQLIGLKKINRNYGHIFIRPETFEDKVSELFIKSEIDFPDFPKFSFRYYCMADKEYNARFFGTSDRLKSIEKQNEILVEVNEDVLISKFSRIITYEDCDSMIEFIKDI